jgi:hypothetical protein
MIYMAKGNQPMQRGIDGAGGGIQAVRGMAIHIHHRVFDFGLDTFDFRLVINILQGKKFIHIKRRKICPPGCTQVPARALDPQNIDLLPTQRIGHLDFGGGIATAGIRDALIRAEQVTAITQAFHRIKLVRRVVIPKIINVIKVLRHQGHNLSPA